MSGKEVLIFSVLDLCRSLREYPACLSKEIPIILQIKECSELPTSSDTINSDIFAGLFVKDIDVVMQGKMNLAAFLAQGF